VVPAVRAVVPIYFCPDVATIFALEKAHGLPYAADPKRAKFPGGYYPEVPMIAIVDNPRRRSEVVAHEVAHSEVARVARHCPRVIDEGLAEYIEEAVLASRPECASILRDLRWRRAQALERASLEPKELFDLGYHEFREERHFAAARCLVAVIVELERHGCGRLRLVIDKLERERPKPWRVLVESYPGEDITELWRKERDSVVAAARPLPPATDAK
jgi:hypothetical protein